METAVDIMSLPIYEEREEIKKPFHCRSGKNQYLQIRHFQKHPQIKSYLNLASLLFCGEILQAALNVLEYFQFSP